MGRQRTFSWVGATLFALATAAAPPARADPTDRPLFEHTVEPPRCDQDRRVGSACTNTTACSFPVKGRLSCVRGHLQCVSRPGVDYCRHWCTQEW